jgi:starch synthase
LKILFAASEGAPYVKTGGLADVAAALPKALAGIPGNEVAVFLPCYKSIKYDPGAGLQFGLDCRVRVGWRSQYAGLFTAGGGEGKPRYYFIDNEYYFYRDGLYGHFDDGERFAFFSLAVMEALRQLDWFPDILHCNDWQSALLPLLAQVGRCEDARLAAMKTLLTIHNIEYQGQVPESFFQDVLALPSEWLPMLRCGDCLNFLKAGIVCADRVSTVSRTYAWELQYPFYAHGLDPVIRESEGKLRGIVNGIDTELYDPATDKNLSVHYSAERPAPKSRNKENLQKLLGLPVRTESPVIAVISRLVAHKGLELVERVMPALMETDLQLVVIGTGEKRFEDLFRWWSLARPNRVAARLLFDSALASRIYAGADMVLMPSKQEPCGLTQLIAMRYGAVPIVRETGGLKDTVPPLNPETMEGRGFTFHDYTDEDMLSAIERACAFYADRRLWFRLRKSVMAYDSSWTEPAGEYQKLYEEMKSI